MRGTSKHNLLSCRVLGQAINMLRGLDLLVPSNQRGDLQVVVVKQKASEAIL